MIDPTRKEWQAARKRFPGDVTGVAKTDTPWDKVVEAVLGCPCPPEPDRDDVESSLLAFEG